MQINEVKVIYTNEPNYIYHYEYFMIPKGFFNGNFYPNIIVIKNGNPIAEEEYITLKNCVFSYRDYINAG